MQSHIYTDTLVNSFINYYSFAQLSINPTKYNRYILLHVFHFPGEQGGRGGALGVLRFGLDESLPPEP